MTAKEYRLEARNALSGNWGVAVGTTIVAMLLGGVSSGSSFEIEVRQTQQMTPEAQELLMQMVPYLICGSIAAILVSIFVGSVVSLGYYRFSLNLIDYSAPEFKDLFSQFRRGSYGSAVALNLLQGLYVLGWSLLFIIPGIIAEYSYAMAPYIMLDHPELSANQCITISKKMMVGHKWDLFCLRISFIGWAILSAFTVGIGNLFLRPYMEAANAAFYRDICDSVDIPVYL